MAERGASTREQLLDVSERMFATRGVLGVSLREIRIAAGARNTAAMQFHFGNREGLLLALTQRHLPKIAAIQDRLYEQTVAEDRDGDPRSLVAVLVRPAAEYAGEGASARAWVKIMSNLASAPDLQLNEFVNAAPLTSVTVGNLLFGLLVEQMPLGIATERLFAVARSATHTVADQARLRDDPAARRSTIVDKVFIENLVDMAHGALFAPVGVALTDRP